MKNLVNAIENINSQAALQKFTQTHLFSQVPQQYPTEGELFDFINALCQVGKKLSLQRHLNLYLQYFVF